VSKAIATLGYDEEDKKSCQMIATNKTERQAATTLVLQNAEKAIAQKPQRRHKIPQRKMLQS